MVNLVIAILAHRKGLSSTGNHEFFPTLFAFQILEFADVYHLQVISCTTIFTLAGSKSIHKTCVLHSSVAGEIVSIIYACFLSPAKTSMIDFTFSIFIMIVLLSLFKVNNLFHTTFLF